MSAVRSGTSSSQACISTAPKTCRAEIARVLRKHFDRLRVEGSKTDDF